MAGPHGADYGAWTTPPGPAFSHFGICVSDLERSLRFYCDALGFEKAESHAIGSEFARLMEFPDVDVTSQFITSSSRPPWRAPGVPGARTLRSTGAAGRQPARVDPPCPSGSRDVAGTAARIVELGGAIVESSRTSIDFGGTALEFVYCTDPDGVRVELMDLGG